MQYMCLSRCLIEMHCSGFLDMVMTRSGAFHSRTPAGLAGHYAVLSDLAIVALSRFFVLMFSVSDVIRTIGNNPSLAAAPAEAPAWFGQLLSPINNSLAILHQA
jgi:hypothetical protein